MNVSGNKGSGEYALEHHHMNLLKTKIKPPHDLGKGNKITKRNTVEALLAITLVSDQVLLRPPW